LGRPPRGHSHGLLCRDSRCFIFGPALPMPQKKAAPAKPAKTGERPAAPQHTVPSKMLDTFPNPNPQRDFLIHMSVPEFTCLCPLTGQPDFATIQIDTIPDARCIELKSLKLYMWSYRNEGAFHEAVTNRILDDIVAAIAPRFVRVTAKWYVRGGIYTNVVVEHQKKGWKPAPRVELSRFDMPTSVA